MNYFKSIVKNVYDKVLEDEFLEPLTEQEMYRILSLTSRRKLSSHASDLRKLSIGEPQKDLFEKIQMIGHVSPDREFRLLGIDPRYEIINARTKELKEDLEQVTGIMMENFPRYQKKLSYAIREVDNLKSLYQARKNSMELRTKLKKLEQANQKSKKITQLNIKMKNLKTVMKVLKQIPNIHKMSLIQLKSINITALKSRQTLSKLNSLKGVENFIDSIVSTQISSVLKILEKCLVENFQEELYQNALKNFLVAQHDKIVYQKLLIKMVEKEIRKTDNEGGGEIEWMCKNYIKLMINLHGVFRWHREHQEEEAWKSISEQNKHLSISINIQKVTEKLSQIMDQCLKDSVLEKLYHCQGSQLLELLYYLTRISKIVWNFSGKNLGEAFLAVSNFLGKKLQKLRDKAKNQLKETLQLETINQWNRLPVPNDYSHEPLDKILYQIQRHKKSQDFQKMKKLVRESKSIIVSEARVSEKKIGEEQKKKRSASCIFSAEELQKYINIPNEAEEEEEEEEVLEIQPISFPFAEKFERFREEVKLKLQNTEHYQQEVVICQSSLTVLKYFSKLVEYGFYYPIPPCSNMTPDIIFFLFDSYAYFVFNSFASAYLKFIFFSSYEELENTENQYLKKRLHFQYPHAYEFIHRFKKENNLLSREGVQNGQVKNNKESEKAIRARVVGTESINFLSCYIQHLFSICGWDNDPQWGKKIQYTKLLYFEISEIVYTDCVPRVSNLKSTQSIIENIKWSEDEGVIKEFSDVLAKNFKEFFYQMKAQNKGEVPLNISEKIFGIFWKTQLTIILKSFLTNYRPSTSSSGAKPKNRLEIFIDWLYTAVSTLAKDKKILHLFYEKVKSVFPILVESDWQVAFEMLKISFIKFEFVYIIQMKSIMCSESCCHLGAEELEKRKRKVEEWVFSEMLKDCKGHGNF